MYLKRKGQNKWKRSVKRQTKQIAKYNTYSEII